MSHAGYTTVFAQLGAMAGAYTLGMILTNTKAYWRIQMAISAFSLAFMLSLVFAIEYEWSLPVVLLIAFLTNFFAGGSNAIDVDFATELTYPLPPNIASYCLTAGNFGFQFLLSMAISATLDAAKASGHHNPLKVDTDLKSTVFYVLFLFPGLMLLAVIMNIFIKEDLRRTKALAAENETA